MNLDYQLNAGTDSVVIAEKSGNDWYTIVRDGEVKGGDQLTDKRRAQTFEVIGFGAPFYVAEVCIEDAETDYYTTIIIDHHEAVRNYVSYETIAVCQAFLKPVCHNSGDQQQNDSYIALASGWR